MLAGKGFTLSRPRAVPSRPSPPHLEQNVRLAGGVGFHLHVKASAAARSISAVNDQFLNREEERSALNLRFDKNPKEMLILLGPANSGKSVSVKNPLDHLLGGSSCACYQTLSAFATKLLPTCLQRLLKEVKKYRELFQAAKGEGPPPVLYLNCRGKDVASPQGFANAIRELVNNDAGLQKWWEKLGEAVEGDKVKLPGYEKNLGNFFRPAADKAPMASIIDSLTTFLEATRPLPYKPVIVIDEANKLMRWSDDPGHRQLKDLLDFFVKITKEDHLGHVALASSESFVIDFLKNGKLRKCVLAMGQCYNLSPYLFDLFPSCSFTS
jgi:Cdc6-like AAA superfamily ATPase